MIELPRGKFDVYALALPRGHGFGDQLPREAWEAENGTAWAIVTRHVDYGDIGLIANRGGLRARPPRAPDARPSLEVRERASALRISQSGLLV
jgi:hypothetical protein